MVIKRGIFGKKVAKNKSQNSGYVGRKKTVGGVSLGFRTIYSVNRIEVVECLCIDLSEGDVVLFSKSFAILIFGNGLDKGAVEVSAFRLNCSPLRLDLSEVAPEFDPIGGREPDTKGRGFSKEEFDEFIAVRRRTEDSYLRGRSVLFHKSRCKKNIKRAVFKELSGNIPRNFW